MLSNVPVSAVLPAQDLARAKQFYTEKLGLPVVSDMPGGVVFGAGSGTKLVVYERKQPNKAEHTEAGFDVKDLVAEIKELTAKGVTMEQYDMPGLKTDENGIVSYGPMKSAWIKDTEGNIIALNQYVA